MALTATALRTAWGSYYQEGKIGPKDIIDQIMTPTEFKSLFSIRSTKNTAEDAARMTLTRVLQRFQSVWSPLGDIDFQPETILLERVKINVVMKPDDLADSAVQFLIDRGIDRSKMPLVGMIGMYLTMKAQEDDEENEAFKGVTGTITSGTATVAGATRTGVRKKIRDLNTASKLNVITMGAPPTDPVDFVTYIETYYYAIPEKYRRLIKKFGCNKTLAQRFKDGMRKKYNSNYEQASSIATIIDTNVGLVGSTAQAGSNMIWATVEGNAVGFVKQPENKGVYQAEVKDIYDVQIATDWYEALGFLNSLWVWSNDQDLS